MHAAGRAALSCGLLVAVLAASPPGATAGDAAAPSEPIVAGRRVFETKGCVRCHSVGGGAGEQTVGPDLGAKAASWSDVLRFAGALWNHLPAMTEQLRARGLSRPSLSPQEMEQLAAYLFYVKFVGVPGDVERGRTLFEDKHCARCHQLAGQGGTAGPRLDELRDFVSVFFLARVLWNHGPGMERKMQELEITPPRLEGTDVADLVAFLRGGARAPGPLEMAYTESGSPQVGERLFRQRGCVGCHAVDGSGGGPGTGPDLTRLSATLTVSELAAAFWNHGAGMRAKMKERGLEFPSVSDRDMSALLAYLASVQYAGPRGDPARGAAVFGEKSCAACHAVGGQGPAGAPDLAASDAARSALHWAAAMWNHAPAMQAKLEETGRTWPQFGDDEMRDLLAFVRSRATAGAATP